MAGAREGREAPVSSPYNLFIASLSVCSQPTPGYFTDDQTLDFLLQTQDGVGMKKVSHGPHVNQREWVLCLALGETLGRIRASLQRALV